MNKNREVKNVIKSKDISKLFILKDFGIKFVDACKVLEDVYRFIYENVRNKYEI
jgi:hypothetical protein